MKTQLRTQLITSKVVFRTLFVFALSLLVVSCDGDKHCVDCPDSQTVIETGTYQLTSFKLNCVETASAVCERAATQYISVDRDNLTTCVVERDQLGNLVYVSCQGVDDDPSPVPGFPAAVVQDGNLLIFSVGTCPSDDFSFEATYNKISSNPLQVSDLECTPPEM